MFDVVQDVNPVQLANLTMVTNRKGYDNQPYFTPDGRSILYSAVHDSDQADIFRYDLASGVTTRITSTHESEYSPTLSPNGKFITVVRVELDSTQRIWKMKLDGTKPKVLMTEVTDIGYYCWLNKKLMAVWTVGDTTLSIVKVKEQVLRPIARPAGRSFHLASNLSKIAYIKKSTKKQVHTVMQYNFISGATDTLAATFEGAEDIVSNPSGEVMIGSQGNIYSLLPDIDSDWQLWSSTVEHGVFKFYRMAMSPDGTKLAVVVYEGNKP
jgi:Tol biopolymer transport system component